MWSRLLTSAVLIVALISLTPSALIAHEENLPSSSVLLEIVDQTSGGKEVAFQLDLQALEALESREIVTSTLWTNGINRFKGVPLTQLLSAYNIEGSQLRLLANNDHAADIPLDDALNQHALLAYRMNGSEMSRRGKGPLWIVYPFDQSARFRTETVYARSVWQLNKIEVID
ncbi:molybdopterin-dependent oxidoreductase [Cognatishimia activa]|uniref:molybdopterin-dependent oxidoreductase n=1 Tax=Cognatishimia activa TaxID=1715691 RepID=UPI00223289DC|nr:molybdopterin-dependent oxidoreductase [Cognatishimia activa]UZD89710.1 molybdopterin-dependent oxidoreductase [Cognatishimia activa]